jgi:hypothetical protein
MLKFFRRLSKIRVLFAPEIFKRTILIRNGLSTCIPNNPMGGSFRIWSNDYNGSSGVPSARMPSHRKHHQSDARTILILSFNIYTRTDCPYAERSEFLPFSNKY